MGARGPKPDVTAPQSRHLYRQRKAMEAAQALPVEAPAMPTWLGKEGKAEWRRQVEHLLALGALAKIDRPMLALYCETWEEWLELRRLTKKARTIPGSTGKSEITNPLVVQRDAAAQRLESLAAKFCFTPVARSRYEAPPGEPIDKPGNGSVLAFARKRV